MENTNEWARIKDDVLVENNAQTIYDHLNEIENLGKDNKRRWFWELLQNAKDSVKDEVAIIVELTPNTLCFKHNGQPFEREEIAHLIFHGSTKKSLTGKTGKFGTGFMTTHLLSRRVMISGRLSSGDLFSFNLSREGDSVEKLHASLDQSWIDFQASITNNGFSDNEFDTVFNYYLDEEGIEIAKEGLCDLQDIIPIVLAFNEKIKSIHLIYDQTNIQIKVQDRNKKSDEELSDIVIEKIEPTKTNFQRLFLINHHEMQLSCLIKSLDGIDYVSQVGITTPRLYLDFPLFGTEDFKFSVMINSISFRPRKERDGIYLGETATDDNNINKELLKVAFEGYSKLINYLGNKKVNGIYRTLTFGSPDGKSWHDKSWYEDLIRQFIGGIFDIPFIEPDAGADLIAPNNTYIPFGPTDERNKLFDLMKILWPDKIPKYDTINQLNDIIINWEGFIIGLSHEKDFILNFNKLCFKLSTCLSLSNLTEKYFQSNENNAINFLNNLIQNISETKNSKLLNEFAILPDQNGVFHKLSPTIKLDVDLDERLKDIISKDDSLLRERLLDKRIVISKDLVSEELQEGVLNNFIAKVRVLANNPYSNKNAEIIQDLFVWLVQNSRSDKLDNFPVFVQKVNDDGNYTLKELSRLSPLFTPAIYLKPNFRAFIDLFTDEYILSEKYAALLIEKDIEELVKEGFVIQHPFHKQILKFEREDLEKLVINETLTDIDKESNVEIEHQLSSVEVSKISYFDSTGSCYDSSRKSRIKTKRLLEFLINLVIEEDDLFGKVAEISCSCGKTHKLYLHHWLLKLKVNRWVNTGKDSSEYASAFYLSRYFEKGGSLFKKLSDNKVAKLLNMMGVSVGDLTRNIIAGGDENLKFEWDKAMTSVLSVDMTPEEIQDIFNDPSIIDQLRKKKEQDSIILRNLLIGTSLEEIFKEIFEEPQYQELGFNIIREPLGRDFDIEYDMVENGSENIFKLDSKHITVSVELKSTSIDLAKMTPWQGQTAANNAQNYALAVYPYDGLEITKEKVKERIKFVVNIGDILQNKVSKVLELKSYENNARMPESNVEVEITEGQIRYVIQKTIWENGISFDSFVDQLLNRINVSH